MENNLKGKRVLVRGVQSGVYYGTFEEKDGQEVKLSNARNIWRWRGANTLIDLSIKGVKYPNDCRFTPYVDEIILTDICEILICTNKAIESIEGVAEWR